MSERNLLNKRQCIASIIIVMLGIMWMSGCIFRGKDSELHDDAGVVASLDIDKSDMQEIYAGNQIHNEIIARFYPYQNPQLKEYINEIGFSLVEHAERKALPYQFTILHDERIYATAAPGGYIYVTTGLLYFVENEAELAAVIAHEIARIQYRSPRYSDTKKFFESLSQGSMMIGPMFGPYGALAAMGIQLVSLFATSEKSLESQIVKADRLTLEYMVLSEYDPQGLIDFLYKILYSDDMQGRMLLHYLASHPISMSRLDAIEKHFNSLPMRGKTFSVNRDRFIEITRSVRDIYQ